MGHIPSELAQGNMYVSWNINNNYMKNDYFWLLSMCQALCLARPIRLLYLVYMHLSETGISDPVLQKRTPGLTVAEYIEQPKLEKTFVQSWSQCRFHFTSSVGSET